MSTCAGRRQGCRRAPEKMRGSQNPMPLPVKMRAVEISRPGGPEVLKLAERPVPQPKAHEILVKVAAAGVNRPDVLQRSGNYPVPPDASDHRVVRSEEHTSELQSHSDLV